MSNLPRVFIFSKAFNMPIISGPYHTVGVQQVFLRWIIGLWTLRDVKEHKSLVIKTETATRDSWINESCYFILTTTSGKEGGGVLCFPILQITTNSGEVVTCVKLHKKAMEESNLRTNCPYWSSGQVLPFPPNHGISWLFICCPELGQSELWLHSFLRTQLDF